MASPHDVLFAVIVTNPLAIAFNFQETLPHPEPGTRQPAGALADPGGKPTAAAGVSSFRLFWTVSGSNVQYVEFSRTVSTEPRVIFTVFPLLTSVITLVVAASADCTIYIGADIEAASAMAKASNLDSPQV
jgi:hypothetical protein